MVDNFSKGLMQSTNAFRDMKDLTGTLPYLGCLDSRAQRVDCFFVAPCTAVL